MLFIPSPSLCMSVCCAGASVIYEEGEDMDDSLQTHTACSLEACPGGGIKDDVIVLIEDFRQDLSVRHYSLFRMN